MWTIPDIEDPSAGDVTVTGPGVHPGLDGEAIVAGEEAEVVRAGPVGEGPDWT